MKYVYKIMDYTEAEEDLRGIFGITDTELPDKLIHRLSNLPAAERTVQSRVSEPLNTYTGDSAIAIKLAVLYTAAANCLQAVRMNILLKESDTKTTAVRFKDALVITEEDLLSKADKSLDAIIDVINSSVDVAQLSLFSPNIDTITGLSS